MCGPETKRSKIDLIITLLQDIRRNTRPVPDTQLPEEPKPVAKFQYQFRSGHDFRWHDEGTGPSPHIQRGDAGEVVCWRVKPGYEAWKAEKEIEWARDKEEFGKSKKDEPTRPHYRVLLTDDQLVKLINNKTVIVGDVHINRMPNRDISHSRY